MSATKKSTIATTDARARNFACVVYPESAPANWLDIVQDLKIPVFVSPLHDKDINPTGEPKKPHHHVLIAFEGKKSLEQVRTIFEQFNGVGCEVVQSIRGYARYLCHLDNPEKAQYNQADVLQFGGADYSAAIGLPTDKYKAVGEIIDYCKENDIYSYAEVLEYAREFRFDWFRVLCDSCTVVIKEYLKSRAWSADRSRTAGFSRLVSPEGVISDNLEYIGESVERVNIHTGEVL